MSTEVNRRHDRVRLQLTNGEHISVSSKTSYLVIKRLVFRGQLNFGTICQWDRSDARGFEAAVVHFSNAASPEQVSLPEKVAQVLMQHCQSILDVKNYCAQIQRSAHSSPLDD